MLYRFQWGLFVDFESLESAKYLIKLLHLVEDFTIVGTKGGSRTHTPFRIFDFESNASAIPPLWYRNILPYPQPNTPSDLARTRQNDELSPDRPAPKIKRSVTPRPQTGQDHNYLL